MMKAQASRASSRVRPAAWLAGLVLGMAAVLVACGGGGTVPATQPGGLRPLPADYGTRKAVNYSPFRTADRGTEVVTRENVLQDLGLLAQGGFTLLRTFDSSDNFTRLMLQIIKDNQINMKVQLGVDIRATNNSAATQANQTFNNAEIARARRLASEFKDIVIAVSVGNEVLYNGGSTPEMMATYLNTVRASVTQPVTTNDVFDSYASRSGSRRNGEGMPAIMTNLIDFAAIHTYPILYSADFYVTWDWEQQDVPESTRAAAMMDAAIDLAKANVAAVRKYLDGQGHQTMPIVLGEIGWRAVPTGPPSLQYRGHPVNQKMFFDRLTAWGDKSKNPDAPAAIFWFEAFDEPFKATAQPGFYDDGWGLFNVNRQARYVVQTLYPSSQWESGSYTLANAVYAPTVPTVTANRYTVYADAVTAGEAIAPAAQWFGFDSPPNAFAGQGTDATLAAEGTHFMEIGPAPSTATGKDYGWGALTTTNSTASLRQFLTSGKLNFSIKTTYPGKLQFGFGTTVAGAVLVVASNTNADGYGYINDGNWHQVSIPISAFTAAGAKFDLNKVTNSFVIADIYAQTGNTASRGSTTKVFIDAVYWSK